VAIRILKRITVRGEGVEVEVTDSAERERLWKRAIPNLSPEVMDAISNDGFTYTKTDMTFFPESPQNKFRQTVHYFHGETEVGHASQTVDVDKGISQFMTCTVKRQFQDQGVAKQIQQNRMCMVDGLDIPKVRMYASGVGSYVWSKFSIPKAFDSTDDQWEKVKKHCREKLEAVRPQIHKELLKEIDEVLSPQNKNPEDLWFLSSSKLKVHGKDGKSVDLGKYLLIGANYECEHNRLDAEAAQRFETYIKKGKLMDVVYTGMQR